MKVVRAMRSLNDKLRLPSKPRRSTLRAHPLRDSRRDGRMTPESIQLECEARQRQIDQQWAELPYLYAEACREGRATPIQKTKAASSRPDPQPCVCF